jgi:hypothetical protein
MLKKSFSLCLGVAAVAAGVFVAPESAEAAALWSWSFGSSANGAAGTFTTTDVDFSNLVGTYAISQFTLASLNGSSVSAIDTVLALSPSFVYNSTTNYGFINNLGFSDSGGQIFDGSVGNFLLSGSAEYQASLPQNRRRPNLVTLFGVGIALQNRANLQVSLLSTPPDPTPIPTPALLPGLAGLGLATLRKKQAAAANS